MNLLAKIKKLRFIITRLVFASKYYIEGLKSSLSVIRNGDNPTYLEVDPDRYKFFSDSVIDFHRKVVEESKKFRIRKLDFNFRELYYIGHTKNNISEFEFFYNNFKSALLPVDVPTKENNLALCTDHLGYVNEKGLFKKFCPILSSLCLMFWGTKRNATTLHYVLQYTYYFQYYYYNLSRKKNALPSIAVFSNDHTPRYLAASKTLKLFGVDRIYLQHGFVSELFPKLDFELSILWNEASKNVYRKVGSDVSKNVVCLSRRQVSQNSDKEITINNSAENITLQSVVIFPTSLPQIERLNSLIDTLCRSQSIKNVYLKPHPRFHELAKIDSRAIVIKDHRTLGEQFVAIVGNSSVAMELTLDNVSVYQMFELDEIGDDYYGFVKNGLTKKLTLSELRYDSDVSEKIKNYDVDLEILNDYCPILSGEQLGSYNHIIEFVRYRMSSSVRGYSNERVERLERHNKLSFKLLDKLVATMDVESTLEELVEFGVLTFDESLLYKNYLKLSELK